MLACAAAAVAALTRLGPVGDAPPATTGIGRPAPGVTLMLNCSIATPDALVAITVVSPCDTPIRNRLVGEAG